MLQKADNSVGRSPEFAYPQTNLEAVFPCKNWEQIQCKQKTFAMRKVLFDPYKCCVCLDLLKEPVRICSRHIVCRKCTKKGDGTNIKKCPSCRETITTFKDESVIVDFLNQLPISCMGCEWNGLYDDLAIHAGQQCLSPVPCSQARCSEVFTHNALLAQHQEVCPWRQVSRSVQLPACVAEQLFDDKGQFKPEDDKLEELLSALSLVDSTEKSAGKPETSEAEIEDEHYRKCQYVPVDCDYCKASVIRGDMIEHVKECPSAPVKCDLCSAEFQRSAQLAHAKECPLQRIQCSACGYTDTRKKVHLHERSCMQIERVCTMCPGVYVLNSVQDHFLTAPADHEWKNNLTEMWGSFDGESRLTYLGGSFYQSQSYEKSYYALIPGEAANKLLNMTMHGYLSQKTRGISGYMYQLLLINTVDGLAVRLQGLRTKAKYPVAPQQCRVFAMDGKGYSASSQYQFNSDGTTRFVEGILGRLGQNIIIRRDVAAAHSRFPYIKLLFMFMGRASSQE